MAKSIIKRKNATQWLNVTMRGQFMYISRIFPKKVFLGFYAQQ
jgi:hypothetical protein